MKFYFDKIKGLLRASAIRNIPISIPIKKYLYNSSNIIVDGSMIKLKENEFIIMNRNYSYSDYLKEVMFTDNGYITLFIIPDLFNLYDNKTTEGDELITVIDNLYCMILDNYLVLNKNIDNNYNSLILLKSMNKYFIMQVLDCLIEADIVVNGLIKDYFDCNLEEIEEIRKYNLDELFIEGLILVIKRNNEE